MTTITIARPKRNATPKQWQVFGVYDGDDDRYVFGVQTFPADAKRRAERYASRMVEDHHADRLERR